jgi:mono/diheme cytochrome c family protein
VEIVREETTREIHPETYREAGRSRKLSCLIAGVVLSFAVGRAVVSAAAAGALVATTPVVDLSAERLDRGKAVYRRARCVACHKWHGKGGGSYGGAALSLRATFLDRERIIEVVRCGRPGTAMPYYDRKAYGATDCYDLERRELGADLPPRGRPMLRDADIGLVADYVVARLKGKGKVTKRDCFDFWGEGARACQVYK